MPIEKLSISPETLSDEQFDLLREVNPKHLIGPGDPPEQTPTVFLEKYGNEK
jgi:hypothetical protein